mmetsp:Transcript_16144/g.33927  ORF Transcript_16144/g.33927 Transcript_16144/m.33927 type:complete len:258 (+) Transcript_16144:377-1150(+)|eukprot:CAMPEP_0171376570 /NCGR_PEP_ID=MMETSP0879-20121228/18988_1 /TAXON_ID=67004 /ORGANISM="Thalassiosira weissflogii, Strain CCMP1336" /LENGTH=257 /DNA_ID=CAMNT_0011886449 /DNA_START=361 /DNA_END=1134 /DNA_ORIENTATION=-
MIADRAQSTTSFRYKDPENNITWDFAKFASHIPHSSSSKLNLRSSKLDDVVRCFASVIQDGNQIDTSQLLKACRAHLVLIQSGGSALRLVAKDLESNLQKVEILFKKSPREAKHLISLLEIERSSGLHDGNILKDPSAAIGMLWIRRSLSFQSDLFDSLISSRGQHPKDAALDSYQKHLSPYHGWMLRTVFPASLSQIPARETFLSKLGDIEIEDLDHNTESKILKKLTALTSTWEPLLALWKDTFETMGLEDTRRV